MIIIGVIIAFIKIIVGVYLLRTMKKELYFPYLQVRHRIVITMIWTLTVMCINAIFHFAVHHPKFSVTMFSILYPDPKLGDHKDKSYIIIVAVLEYLIYLSEVFLLWFTTNNIDYREYVGYLTQGIREAKLITKISLFLIYVPYEDTESLSESDEDEVYGHEYDERSQSENSKIRLIEYDRQSKTFFKFSTRMSSRDTNYLSDNWYLSPPVRSSTNRRSTEWMSNDI